MYGVPASGEGVISGLAQSILFLSHGQVSCKAEHLEESWVWQPGVGCRQLSRLGSVLTGPTPLSITLSKRCVLILSGGLRGTDAPEIPVQLRMPRGRGLSSLAQLCC